MRNPIQIYSSRETGGNKTVAANVRAQLAYANLAQGELANVLGLSKMAVSRRLNDDTEFTAGEIVLVADFFEIEPGELFVERNPRKTKKTPTPKSEGLDVVGPAGIEPTTSTVEARHLAPVTRLSDWRTA